MTALRACFEEWMLVAHPKESLRRYSTLEEYESWYVEMAWRGYQAASAPAPAPVTGRDELARTCPLSMEQYAPVYGMTLTSILKDGGHTKAFFNLLASTKYEYADAMLTASTQEPPREDA